MPGPFFMAFGYEIKVDTKVLDKYAKTLVDRLSPVVYKTAHDVEAGAKQRVPVDTGATKSSIQVFPEDELTAYVGPTTSYAPFIEFGTGRRGASSNHPDLPSGYRHGPSVGGRAQPFLTPALEAEQKQFRKALTEVMNRVG